MKDDVSEEQYNPDAMDLWMSHINSVHWGINPP